MFARRDPLFAFEFEASLFAFAYDTPPFEFALLLPRLTTRLMGNSTNSATKVLNKHELRECRLQEQPNNGSNSTADKSQDPVKPVPVAAFELVLEFKARSSYCSRINSGPGCQGKQPYKEASDKVFVAVTFFQK